MEVEKDSSFAKANLSKMRFLKLASYFTGLPPVYLVLLPYRAYLREQMEVEKPVMGDPSITTPASNILMMGRNFLLIVLTLMVAFGEGLKKMTEITVYGSLFVGAIGLAIITDLMIFASTNEPQVPEVAPPMRNTNNA